MATKTKAKKSVVKKDDIDKMTAKQLIVHFGGTKSAAIRGLAAHQYSTAEIARKLGIIYQHARNVLHRPLKRKQSVEA